MSQLVVRGESTVRHVAYECIEVNDSTTHHRLERGEDLYQVWYGAFWESSIASLVSIIID